MHLNCVGCVQVFCSARNSLRNMIEMCDLQTANYKIHVIVQQLKTIFKKANLGSKSQQVYH